MTTAMTTALSNARIKRCRRGTSVLSATVALALVAATVSLSVPEWLRARERATACEAIDYLSNVHAAQESYRAIHGHYADDINLLDLALVPPAYFDVGQIQLTRQLQVRIGNFENNKSRTVEPKESWSITLKRYAVQTVFAPYAITCTEDGFSKIWSEARGPLSGLQPKISR